MVGEGSVFRGKCKTHRIILYLDIQARRRRWMMQEGIFRQQSTPNRIREYRVL